MQNAAEGAAGRRDVVIRTFLADYQTPGPLFMQITDIGSSLVIPELAITCSTTFAVSRQTPDNGVRESGRELE